ncbi:MAG: amino acid ABC transporter permease [Hyphomicrobiaceae bacterium]
MDALIQQFFNIEIMGQAFPLMMRGLGYTLLLCAVVIPLGFVGGLGVAMLGTSSSRIARILVALYVDLFRAVPPLVVLVMIYSALPFAGIRLSPFTAVAIAFFLNTSSFYGEILRAGIESVGQGQWHAARSTGLSVGQAYAHVVLPQAVRNVLPDLASNTLEVVKLTALASVVSFQELLYSAEMARSVTYNASPIMLAAIIYLILLWPAVRLVSRLENRMSG